MANTYGLDGKQLEEQYRHFLSGFLDWKDLPHAQDWLIFNSKHRPLA